MEQIALHLYAKKVQEMREAQDNYKKALRAGLHSVIKEAKRRAELLTEEVDQITSSILKKDIANQKELF